MLNLSVPPTPNQSEAQRMVSSIQWIDTPSSYEDLVTRYEQAHVVGIDTEFVRERTYYPRPGLVQVSDGASVTLLDVVNIDEHSVLGTLMADPNTIKVFHSVGEDLEVIDLLTQKAPTPLIDTQWAAALVGHPFQMRYEHLVDSLFSVSLPGGQARSDWTRRPLDSGLLSYAAQDVIFLPALAHELCTQLDQMGRLQWLLEDCDRLIETRRDPNPELMLAKLKGASRLSQDAMAYASALVQWRDEVARAKNRPRSFIMDDESLANLAQQVASQTISKGLDGLAHRYRRLLDDLAKTLEDVDAKHFTVPSSLQPLTPEQRTTLKRLQKEVRLLAESLRIDPALIASKRELTRLVKGEKPEWLSGWRGDLLADPISDLLQ